MDTRAAIIGGAALLLLAAAGGSVWYAVPAATPELESAGADPLPIPPVPPRIAEGADYERCLATLITDPADAATLAQSITGDGGVHCLALSKIALGAPAAGAQMLESLAAASPASAVARAAVYGQATQAWLMAGDPAHALGAATLALSLSPDDPDLLIDRAAVAGGVAHAQDAVHDLSRALEIDPRRIDALIARAGAWRQLGRLDQAQDDIDHALSLDPDNPEALLERGILRQRRNDRNGARTDWERAVSIAPATATADLAEQNLALLEAGPDRR